MSSWSIDPTHSQISFSVRHMMFAKVRGSFGRWRGAVDLGDDGALRAVSASVEVDSIDTREPQRDAHLRSPDFFDAATWPTMDFQSRAVRPAGPGRLVIDGELTLHGVTQPLALEVEATGEGRDPWGNTRRGYRATARLRRADFGLTWNAALELGGVLVGEEVDIEVEVQLVRAA